MEACGKLSNLAFLLWVLIKQYPHASLPENFFLFFGFMPDIFLVKWSIHSDILSGSSESSGDHGSI
jgi:hypothetical protein